MVAFRAVLTGALALALSACQLGYYGQAVSGHWSLMSKRVPVQSVLDDPATSPELAEQLRFSQQVIAWSGEHLALPADDVYHQYVSLEQEAVVWNVMAAPAFSLTPKTWCYLLVGCVSYRGYFDREEAEALARQLSQEGLDTWVGGAIAYSTLGWFADPLTTPMLDRSRPALAELLIHELAHRKRYIKDDTRFNESLATLVGREGAIQFFADEGLSLPEDYWARRDQVRQAFLAIVTDTREKLAALYQSGRETPAMVAEKARLQQQARQRFQREREQMPALAAYQGFFDGPLNNAQLNGVSDYNDYVPAFARLLEQCRQDWDCFWQRVDELAALEAPQRSKALETLVWN